MAFIRLISQISEEEYLRCKQRREEHEERERQEYEQAEKERRKIINQQRKLMRAKKLVEENEERWRRRRSPPSPIKVAENKAKREQLAGRPMPDTCEVCGKSRKLVFDHCHKHGHFRGWICNSCNRALGVAWDDEELLRKLADYLARDRQRLALAAQPD